jgi:hypothetical protein
VRKLSVFREPGYLVVDRAAAPVRVGKVKSCSG